MNQLSVVALAAASVLLVACGEERFPTPNEVDELNSLWGLSQKPAADTSNRFATNPKAIALGKKLFEDKAFSSCGQVSCASCHQSPGYAYDQATAPGCDGNRTARNPPSLLHIAQDEWFMWDGRADRLWSQAILPLTSPVEMNGSAATVRARMTEGYAAEYQDLFGAAPASEEDNRLLANFGKALAAYEGTILHPTVSFDADVQRFLGAVKTGDQENDPAYLGLKTFVRKGRCVVCHKGPTLSDGKFHNIGVEDRSDGAQGRTSGVETARASIFRADGAYSDAPADFAHRFEVLDAESAQDKADRVGAFKTPTLRSLKQTAPYMHTGALGTLADVIDFYDKGGGDPGSFTGTKTDTLQKLNLSNEEKAALTKLLESMSAP